MSLDCSNQRDAFPSPSPSPSRSAASPSTPLSPQIRVKLSEDVNTKDVLLNLKVKSEEKVRVLLLFFHSPPFNFTSDAQTNTCFIIHRSFRLKKKSPAGTYTASPGKVALEGIEDELEATDSPMKQALAAAEAFEKGQSPPDKNQAKKENAAAFENTKASFEVQEVSGITCVNLCSLHLNTGFAKLVLSSFPFHLPGRMIPNQKA